MVNSREGSYRANLFEFSKHMTNHNDPLCIWVHGVPSFMYRGDCVHGPLWWKAFREDMVKSRV